MALVVKNLFANIGDIRHRGLIPGQEDPLEKGMAAHSSVLAWRIPWAEEPGGLQSIRSQRVEHDWSTLACMLYSLQAYSMVIKYFYTLWNDHHNESSYRSFYSISDHIPYAWFLSLWLQSVQFSQSVVSESLRPHGLQHARLPCPSSTPRDAQTQVHWVSDAIQPSHLLLFPSPAFNLSQHPGLFQWVISSPQVAKVSEFQHQSCQWIFSADLL